MQVSLFNLLSNNLDYLLANDSTSAIFVAADNQIAKRVGNETFGKRYFELDVVPAGPGENLGGSMDLRNQIGDSR